MKIVKRLAVVRNYTKANGEEGSNWTDMGVMFKKDNGKFSIKIDAIPAGDWDGWVQLLDPRDESEERQARMAPAPQTASQPEVLDDDIPF